MNKLCKYLKLNRLVDIWLYAKKGSKNKLRLNMEPTLKERYSWLTKEYFETILKSSENQLNVKVIDYELHDAVGKGDNYLSYLMRATVNYTDASELNVRQKTFIIKTDIESVEMSGMLERIGLFDKEITFYRDVLPKFDKYLNLIDKNFECAPKPFATNTQPTYIILEDLKARNYHNMDRRIGLDFNATAMVLEKVAKLHAINAMIYEDCPEIFEPYKLCILSTKNTEILSGYTSGVRDCQQMCLKWPGFEHLYDKLQHWLDNAAEIAELTYHKDDSTFNTLTHGDLWINNVMYQFDEKNKPVNLLLVDYQFGCYGPPALDLTYLFYTSTKNDLFEQDWDRLLQIYHAELVKCLVLLKYPKRIPTLTELQIQMLKKSLCGAMLSLTLVPPRQMDGDDKTNLEMLMSNSEEALKCRYAMFDKPAVCERIQYLLKYFDRKGFFESLP